MISAKRHSYAIKTRLEAIEWNEEHGVRATAKRFQVSPQSIRRWLAFGGASVEHKCDHHMVSIKMKELMAFVGLGTMLALER